MRERTVLTASTLTILSDSSIAGPTVFVVFFRSLSRSRGTFFGLTNRTCNSTTLELSHEKLQLPTAFLGIDDMYDLVIPALELDPHIRFHPCDIATGDRSRGLAFGLVNIKKIPSTHRIDPRRYGTII